MERETTESEPECLLGLSAHLLSLRYFTDSRKYALLAQQSDPNLAGVTQVLAVADILLAAERKKLNHHLDWYPILQLNRSDSDNPKLIRTQFKKLLLLLNPIKNKFAFSEDAFKLACDAWSAQSDPEKTQHKNDVVNAQNPQEKDQTQERFEKVKKQSRSESVNGTFWTVCPYCYYVYEYEKVYEECCLRCQNCRRAFHGVALAAPPNEVAVEGKEGQYYCCYGFFPLGYSGPVPKKVEEVVEISDDSEDSLDDFGSEEEGIGLNVNGNSAELKNLNAKNVSPEGNMSRVKELQEEEKIDEGLVKQGSEKVEKRYGKRPMKNVKTVARNTKKIMGTGMRRRNDSVGEQGKGGVELNGGFGKGVEKDGNGIGGVEFFEGDDDIIVGIPDAW